MAPSRAERVARDARDQALCTIASSCRPDERAELTRALREAGSLTPALLMRSLLGGDRALFTHALAELSGLPLPRVTAFILEPQGEGFAALARRAGLKNGVGFAFRAALAALKTHVGEPGDGLKPPLVQKVIDACEQRDDPALIKVRALLWRFAAEAARAEAAQFAREAAASVGFGVDFGRPAAAGSGLFTCQRPRRSSAEAARGPWLAPDAAGARAAVAKSGRGSRAAHRIAARACRPPRRGGVNSGACRRFAGRFRHRLPRLSHRLPQH